MRRWERSKPARNSWRASTGGCGRTDPKPSAKPILELPVGQTGAGQPQPATFSNLELLASLHLNHDELRTISSRRSAPAIPGLDLPSIGRIAAGHNDKLPEQTAAPATARLGLQTTPQNVEAPPPSRIATQTFMKFELQPSLDGSASLLPALP
jgi:hypothetical protein